MRDLNPQIYCTPHFQWENRLKKMHIQFEEIWSFFVFHQLFFYNTLFTFKSTEIPLCSIYSNRYSSLAQFCLAWSKCVCEYTCQINRLIWLWRSVLETGVEEAGNGCRKMRWLWAWGVRWLLCTTSSMSSRLEFLLHLADRLKKNFISSFCNWNVTLTCKILKKNSILPARLQVLTMFST